MSLGQVAQETTDTIGGRLSLAREALELTGADAASAISVCADVWSDWERDRCAPPPQLLGSIAQSLQITLYWLLTGRGIGPSWHDLPEVSPNSAPCYWQAGTGSCLPDVFLRSDRLTDRR